MSSTDFVMFQAFIGVVGVFVLYKVNQNIPAPYMDEEFHYMQTINFFQGEFSYWNPKLTTFPGLFLISSFLAYFFNLMGLIRSGLNFLRGVNVFYGWLFSYFAGSASLYNTPLNTLYFQMVLTLLPINYFYNFLFYTDTLSTLLVFYYLITAGHLISQNNRNSRWVNFIVFIYLIFI